ncbi:hypothetical protein C8R47DRAFT_614342 [Mycena vitilis]|nr:hypothetical protein C8R47DRAFT_614342 [Mycena vitilis]
MTCLRLVACTPCGNADSDPQDNAISCRLPLTKDDGPTGRSFESTANSGSVCESYHIIKGLKRELCQLDTARCEIVSTLLAISCSRRCPPPRTIPLLHNYSPRTMATRLKIRRQISSVHARTCRNNAALPFLGSAGIQEHRGIELLSNHR